MKLHPKPHWLQCTSRHIFISYINFRKYRKKQKTKKQNKKTLAHKHALGKKKVNAKLLCSVFKAKYFIPRKYIKHISDNISRLSQATIQWKAFSFVQIYWLPKNYMTTMTLIASVHYGCNVWKHKQWWHFYECMMGVWLGSDLFKSSYNQQQEIKVKGMLPATDSHFPFYHFCLLKYHKKWSFNYSSVDHNTDSASVHLHKQVIITIMEKYKPQHYGQQLNEAMEYNDCKLAAHNIHF